MSDQTVPAGDTGMRSTETERNSSHSKTSIYDLEWRTFE
jgi:hypothetical protein